MFGTFLSFPELLITLKHFVFLFRFGIGARPLFPHTYDPRAACVIIKNYFSTKKTIAR